MLSPQGGPFRLKASVRFAISLSLLFSLGSTQFLGLSTPAFAVGQTPAVVEVKLPTGQTLYIKEDHSRPIVTIDTWVKTGSVNEVAQNNGVSHFLEHLLFKGTRQYKAGQIDRLLESRGSEFNAATSDDFTHYYITTAPAYFEEALKLHADMMTHAVVPPQELPKERKVVQEEINRANDNPSRQLYVEVAKRMYGSHGYALDTLGPKQNIANIPREDILNYYHYWYRPQNFNTIIVGDIDAETVKKQVEAAFPARGLEAFGHYSPPVAEAVDFSKQGPQALVLKNPTINQGYLAIALPGPPQQKPEDVYALDLAMLALGSGKSSRLYQALVEQKTLATSVSASNYTQKYSGLVVVDAEAPPEKLAAIKEEVFKQLTELRLKSITPQELEKAKTQYVKDFVFENESTDGTASAIGYNVTIGNLADYNEHVARVQAVTPERIRMALNQYLDPKKAIVAELVPENTAIDAAQETKADLQRLNTWAKDVNVADQAESKAEAKGDIPASAPQAPEVTIHKIVLPNGMTLITKPIADSATVAMKLYVKGGGSVEAKPGVASLVASLLMQGSQGRTAEELSSELESKGMNLSISADDDFIDVSGTAIQEDWGELSTVLQNVLTSPRFDPAEIDKKKEQVRQVIAANRDNPSSVAFENLRLALYPNHAYGDVGRRVEKALVTINRDDLLQYYRQNFQPQNMVVSLVGRFDPKAVKAFFSALYPDAEAVSETRANTTVVVPTDLLPATPKAVPMLTSSETVTEEKPHLSAVWIAQGWLAPPIQNAKDYAALKVLNTLIGSGMSSRLFVDLREKQGLAYVVGSQYPSHKLNGSFTMYIGTDPVNLEKVQAGFKKELNRIQRDLVTKKELTEAKSKLIGGFALAHDTNATQANYLSLYETLGVGYQFDVHYPELIRKVTENDVRRVAQHYFSAPSVVSIVKPKGLVSVNQVSPKHRETNKGVAKAQYKN
jgi:zinc protease